MKKTLLLNFLKAATSRNPRKNTTHFNGLLALFVMVIGMGISYGQVTLPHHDPLNYTVGQGLQSQTNWTTLNSGDDLAIASGNLSYSGLPTSTGNKVVFSGTGIDAAKLFTQKTSGTVYYSFILNVTSLGSLNTSGGYFTAFNEGTSANYGGTVWLRQDGSGFDIGINPRTTAANTVWSTGTQNIDTNILVVISYEIVASTTNDVVRLWINPSLGGSQPSATLSATNSIVDLINLNRILIRQDGTTATPSIEMDELRIGTTWASVTPTTSTWDGSEWTNGAPNSSLDAIINGDYTETADISCKDLTINSGKTLTIGASNSLTVAGNLVNNGNLIFKSTSAGTARFASYSGAAITSSNITVERYLPARRAWRLLTAPLKGSTGNTVAANWQGTANEGLLLFSPATYQSTAMTGYTTGGSRPNIWKYNSASTQWQSITDISAENLFSSTVNNGFLVFATGPHGSNTIASSTTAEATTLKPKGELITGTVNYTGLTAGQFHLLGNPYASPIDVARLRTSNESYTFYLLDPSLGDANSRGGYYTYNGSWAPNTPSNALIQSGQGFFVKSASATTFDVAESHKDSGNSNIWFDRTTADTSFDKIRVLLYKQDNSAWYLADGILAVNSASGNHEVDAADADKMTNFNENLLFKNGTSNLAIEYRGLPAAGTLQPMQLTGTSAQPYELRLKTENYSNSNLTPYLENTQTGVLTEIPTDGSEVIVPFTGIAATSAAPDSRFRIVYQSPLSADDLNSLVVGVYPNPVHDSLFTIELANTNATASYTLTNLLGQEVQKGTLMALTNTIPVHDLSEGVYLLQVNQEGKRFTTKLMIK
jgi:hypothetical protein